MASENPSGQGVSISELEKTGLVARFKNGQPHLRQSGTLVRMTTEISAAFPTVQIELYRTGEGDIVYDRFNLKNAETLEVLIHVGNLAGTNMALYVGNVGQEPRVKQYVTDVANLLINAKYGF